MSNKKAGTKEFFWSRVLIGKEDECWPWRGARSKSGYGVLRFNYQRLRAHRLAFFLENGFYPDVVMHACDNPSCCNPAHLSAGTPKENALDKVRKGRQSKLFGEKNPSCRISEKDVVEIRRLSMEGKRNCEIARIMNLRQSTVHKISTGTRRNVV